MTHLRKRLERLEAQRGCGAVDGPSVIFIVAANSEVMAALFMDGASASRSEGESEVEFIQRAEQAASTNDQKGAI